MIVMLFWANFLFVEELIKDKNIWNSKSVQHLNYIFWLNLLNKFRFFPHKECFNKQVFLNTILKLEGLNDTSVMRKKSTH